MAMKIMEHSTSMASSWVIHKRVVIIPNVRVTKSLSGSYQIPKATMAQYYTLLILIENYQINPCGTLNLHPRQKGWAVLPYSRSFIKVLGTFLRNREQWTNSNTKNKPSECQKLLGTVFNQFLCDQCEKSEQSLLNFLKLLRTLLTEFSVINVNKVNITLKDIIWMGIVFN